MKRILLFAVLMMAVALPYAAGQGAASSTGHFEWAKGYNSNMDGYIKGTVTDSLGNLYILGQVHWASIWDDTLSVGPPLSTQNTMVLVAKISPEGEMVWKKMFGNDVSSTFADDIKPLGDTGFAVMFDDNLIIPGYGMRYWGDSMCNDVNHPLISPCDTPGLRFGDSSPTIFMAFDFDGNVIEQHALEITFLDSDGNDFERSMYQSPDSLPWLRTSRMYLTTFDVDNDGNIYVCYRPGDFPDSAHYANYDRLAATRYWVDHRLVGESTLGNNTTEETLWYPQLVKFSPHFDTLLASRHVVQKSFSDNKTVFPFVKIDKQTNELYTRLYMNMMYGSPDDTVIIDSIVNYFICHPGACSVKGIIIIFDSTLTPHGLIDFNDTLYNPTNRLAMVHMKDIEFDNDSNLVFISCSLGSKNGVITYNGSTINSMTGVVVLNKSNLMLHSVLEFPCDASGGSLPQNELMFGDLKVSKNRVFLQATFYHRINFPSGYYISYSGNPGSALAIWDYQGNLIDGLEYHTYDYNNSSGSIALVDSNLYLVNHLATNATFGNIQYYVMSYAACVAKYVDPAFMDVYQPVGIAEVDVTNHTIYPNPVENLLHVKLENDNILQATAISVLGTQEQLDAVGNTVDVSRLQSGIYIMELTTVRGTYNFKFIKQ